MKFTAALLAILLIIGSAAAMHITVSIYDNDQCTGTAISSTSIDIKSGGCTATGAGSQTFSRSGDDLEICAYSDSSCKENKSCSKGPSNACASGIKYEVLGSASSVAFSGLFVVAAAVMALAF